MVKVDLKIECKYNLEFLPLYLGKKYEEKKRNKDRIFKTILFH